MKNFIDKKYPDLHKSKPIERAVKQTGENMHIKDEKIEVYLDRLEKLILDPKKEQKRKDMFEGESRPRALSLLREKVIEQYVRSSLNKKTEGAVRNEENAGRELGMNIQYGEEQINQRQEILIKDLEKSLDNWIAYLSDNNEPYPMWFRYYVFRNVLNLGDFDKDKGEFRERSQGSAYLFPDIDHGALAYIQDVIEASKDEKILNKLQEAQKIAANNNLKEGELLTKEKAENFSKMSFAKQYTEAIKLSGEITPEMREETRGKWVKYQQNTDPTALWASLQNKGTAWCTKGFATATTQLNGGDFYVYYTLDKTGQPTIPRIAIRMNGQNQIGEVRGVADNKQNLEGNIMPILEEKFKDFGSEKDRYKKKSSDMKKMTELYNKSFKEDKKTGQKEYLNPVLNKEELVFLYEINSFIEGFGYEKDPRIAELRKQRKSKEDAPIVFECKPEEIAYSKNEINENTKAYIGPLFEGIFKKDFEYIYTSFPEGKLQKYEVEIGGKTKDELKKEIKEKFYLNSYAESMMDNPDFTVSKNKEKINTVRLKVSDLGFDSGNPTTDEIYKKAEELGLELCPAETGPHLRLELTDQLLNDYFRIAMKQINDSGRRPCVFRVHRLGVGRAWLRYDHALPTRWWDLDDEFLFRFRKST